MTDPLRDALDDLNAAWEATERMDMPQRIIDEMNRRGWPHDYVARVSRAERGKEPASHRDMDGFNGT